MFKVGDKVRIKDEIGFNETSIINIEELKKKVLTVEYVGDIRQDGSYHVDICDEKWAFSSDWLELVENEELNKFKAFLMEVANVKASSYSREFNYLWDLTHGIGVEEDVAYLVDFYKTFEKPQPKKLTMAELRDIVGEDFEIVEG
jgi:hypothetical protein